MKATIAALSLTLFSHAALAGNDAYTGNVSVGRLVVTDTRVEVGFLPNPPECAGTKDARNAYISKDKPGFDEMYELLLAAKLNGKKLDIWYNLHGDCTYYDKFLEIVSLGMPEQE